MPTKTSHSAVLVLGVCAFPWCFALCVAMGVSRQCQRLLSSLLGLRKSLTPIPRSSARLVILIPSYNVENTIGRALRGCLADPLTSLIVVVDGGSTDSTIEAAHAAATAADDAAPPGSNSRFASRRVVVVKAPPGTSGRANCLNYAARVAADHGDDGLPGGADGGSSSSSDAVLVSLHADTVLPEGFGSDVADSLADGNAAVGSFRIYTKGVRDGPTLGGRLVGLIANTLNNVRSVWMETPYGDQALFCTRSCFEAVGGYPPVPLMEDSAFVWAARKHGTVAIAKTCVCSFASPQWAAMGALYVCRNYLFLCAWAIGAVAPEALHRFYYPGRNIPAAIRYADIQL